MHTTTIFVVFCVVLLWLWVRNRRFAGLEMRGLTVAMGILTVSFLWPDGAIGLALATLPYIIVSFFVDLPWLRRGEGWYVLYLPMLSVAVLMAEATSVPS